MLLEQAISDSLQTGNAVCKFISRNEVGSTGCCNAFILCLSNIKLKFKFFGFY